MGYDATLRTLTFHGRSYMLPVNNGGACTFPVLSRTEERRDYVVGRLERQVLRLVAICQPSTLECK